MDYKRGQKQLPKKVSKRFVLSLGFFCTLLLVAGGAYLYVDLSKDDVNTRVQNKSTQPVQVVAGKQSFETPFFMFETNADWTYLEQFSIDSQRYRYQKSENGIPKASLQIIINDTSEREVEHILPVERDGRSLEVMSSTSSHCNARDQADTNIGKEVVTLNGVRFLCNVDGTTYTVAAGLVDGGIRIPFQNELGEVTTFTVLYEDVRFQPNAGEFEEIISSLKII